MQLELFYTEKTEAELFSERLDLQEKATDNLRKGLFKRHGELCRMMIRLQDQQEELGCQIQVIKKLMTEHYEKPKDSITQIA